MDIITNHSFPVEFMTKDDSNLSISNTFTGCTVCGKNHETDTCAIFDNLIHVNDTKVPPRALLTLPPNLRVETLADGNKTVIATNCIQRGTQFGPYEAKHLYSVNPFAIFPVKIFGDSENILPDCYLDTTNEEQCNWMCYVSPAHNMEEQNLICYQLKLDIYFSAIKEIKPGEQLKVWYSPYYASKMEAKIFSPKAVETLSAEDLLTDVERIQKVAEKLPASKLGAEEKQNWCCKMCGQVETNVVAFARHLQNHYMKIINNYHVCDICDEGFSSEKLLTKHRRVVHVVFTNPSNKPIEQENESVIKIDSKIMEPCLPLPIDTLMNETLTEPDSDQLDNPNLLMLDPLSLTNSALYNDLNDVDTLRAILCDDNTKASKTAQEKSIADFSLELVSDEPNKNQFQPPFTCDICNKQFQTLRYLCRHIKKHTGEFTCVQCLVVFTRKENYLRHPCFISEGNNKLFNCSFCQKSFLQKKYLRRHMTRHTQKYTCNECGKRYTTLVEKNQHNCSSIPNSQKKEFHCDICNQKFLREMYLKKHIKNCHKNTNELPISTDTTEAKTICEICAENFKNVATLKQHMLIHSEPKYECVICYKKFYRADVYSNHLLSHGTAQFSCELCDKKLKTKKCLSVHMLQHGGERRYTCNECGKSFLQRSNMLRHQNTHAQEGPIICQQCNLSFETNAALTKHKRTTHGPTHNIPGTFKCSICEKIFAQNYLLKRHIAHIHTDKMYSCPYCTKTQVFKHRTTIRRHLRRIHADRKEEWSDPAVISGFLINPDVKEVIKPENILDVANTEVLISVPETEQQITLGKNAYILEDGTIVQPQEEGNIIYYVLDDQLKE